MREADTLSFTRQLVWHSPSLPQRPLSLIRISFLVLESVPHPHFIALTCCAVQATTREADNRTSKGSSGKQLPVCVTFVLARWQQSYIREVPAN